MLKNNSEKGQGFLEYGLLLLVVAVVVIVVILAIYALAVYLLLPIVLPWIINIIQGAL